MDFLSTSLVTLTQPTGFWATILNSFKGAMGAYVLAVILIAVIVRVLFTIVDIINKKINMKNMDINAKMKPELDAIAKRYGNDPKVMQQKQAEIYKKYQVSMMGSCLPMLITMILQFVVFLTLWNSLQRIANFNIAEKYENMKNIYANIIEINDSAEGFKTAYESAIKAAGSEYKVEARIEDDKVVIYVISGESKSKFYEKEFKKDFALTEPGETEGEVKIVKTSNETIYELLQKYGIVPVPEEPEEEPAESSTDAPEEETEEKIEYVDTGVNDVLKALAEKEIEKYFEESKESFLWIKNVYRPESPSTPMFTKTEIIRYLSQFYSKQEKDIESAKNCESGIFDCIIKDNAEFDGVRSQKNGYYILAILAVLTSVLSMWLSNKLMRVKGQPAQPQSKMMYVLMPLIMGIFTIVYTSLFAIYIIVGQLIMIALTPLTTWIVKKWTALDMKKKSKKEKDVIEVDYRRKDM